MFIKRLRLKNFTSYVFAEIDFPKTSIAIVGPNGAGKSSILDAIFFSLYGESLRGKLSDIVRINSREMEVKLEFEYSGNKYKVKRRVLVDKNRVQSDAFLYIFSQKTNTWSLLAKKVKSVNEEIKKILGIDRNMFLSAYYVRQGEIASLLTMEPQKRKELIAKLLRLTDLEKAYENMRFLLNEYRAKKLIPIEKELESAERLKSEYSDVTEELARIRNRILKLDEQYRKLLREKSTLEEALKNLEEARKQLEDYKRRLEFLKAKYEDVCKELENVRKEIDFLEKLEKEFEAKKDEFERIKKYVGIQQELQELIRILNKLTDIEKTYTEYEARKKRLKELSSIAEKYKELSKKIDLIQQKKEQLYCKKEELIRIKEKIAQREEDIKRIEEDISRIKKRLPYLENVEIESLPKVIGEKIDEKEKELREILKLHSDVISESEQIKARKKQITKWLDQLETIKESKCPLCGSELTPAHKSQLITKYRKELEELEKRLTSINGKLENIVKTKENLERELALLRSVDLDAVKEQIYLISQYAKELQELRKNLDDFSRIEEIIENLDKESIEIKKEISSIEDLYFEYKYTLDHIKSLEEKIREIQNELSILQERKTEISEFLRNKGIEERYIENPAELISLSNKAELLKKELDLLQEHLLQKKQLIQSLEEKIREKEKIEEEINRLLAKIKQYEDITSAYQETRERLNRIIKEVGDLQARIEENKENYARLKKKRDELKNELERIEKLKKEYEMAKNIFSELEKIRKAFSKDGVQKEIRKIIIPKVQLYARRFLEYFNTDIKDVILDDDFNIFIRDSNGVRSITTLSGGEQVILALSLRLAISKSISNEIGGMLMFDEPTANLDEEKRRSLVDALKELFYTRGALSQMIIVTHDRDLEEAVEEIYEVEKTLEGSLVRHITFD